MTRHGHDVREIMSMTDKELSPLINKNNNIKLEKNSRNNWLITTIQNNTKRKDWVLDFGGLENGNSGNIKKLFVYNAQSKSVIYSDLQSDQKSDFVNDRQLFIQIKPHTKTKLLIRIEATTGKNLILNPVLKSVERDLFLKRDFVQAVHSFLISNLPLVFFTSLVLLVIVYNDGRKKFLPIIALFYVINFVWFVFIDNSLKINYAGIEILDNLIPPLNSLMILTASALIIKNLGELTLRSTLPITALGGLLITFIIAEFFAIFDDPYFYGALNILSMISILFSLLLIKSKSNNMPYVTCFFYWMAIYFSGYILSYLSNSGIVSTSPLIMNAEYYSFYVNVPVLLMMSASLLRHSKQTDIDQVTKRLQKAQSIMNAKTDKDSNGQARLLRVIEREREVMEELRGRESQRTEEMRSAKVIADEANQAKSAFLAVVSHEIRTPMTGVMGMIRMLEDTDITPEQKKYIMTIRDSGDAMLSLLNDILDFSKIEGGAMEIEHIEFDLSRVLNGIMLLMKGHADQKEIEINLNINKDIPLKTYGDPTRLRQIVLNLVSNALKFTDKGHVTITATKESETNVIFSIQDTGIGISEKAQKNLFIPFSQADSSVSRKYGGTGLGLSICKKLIEAMDGTISVKSEEGHGTTFQFSLPLIEKTRTISDEKEINKNATTDTSDIAVSPMSVLVVDDNAINQLVITSFLDKNNHTHTTCSGGKEALSVLHETPTFDAIFLDIEMPDMNGRDVIKEILSQDTLKAIPVIAVTGNISTGDIEEYMSLGFTGCLAKPIDPIKLQLVLADIQNGNVTTLPDNSIKTQDRKTKKHSHPALGKTLDDELLKGLKEGLGEQETMDLLDSLLTKSDEIIIDLRKSYEADDRESVRMRSHEMKGMCANFGLKAVSEKSGEIEKFTKNPDASLNDIKADIEDLSTLVERSKIALDEFMKG